MGRIAGAFGIRGWVKVLPYGDDGGLLATAGEWHLGEAAEARRVEASKPHGAALVAKLAGVADRAAAEALRGCAVRLPRAAFPPAGDGEVYRVDLEGLEVRNLRGEHLGRVRRLAEFGAQYPVLEIAREGRSGQLLPWVAQVVKRVDLDAGRVEVDWEADW